MTPRAPRAGPPPSRTGLAEGTSDVQGRSRVAPESGHPPSRTDLAEAVTVTPRAPRAGRRLVTLSASLAFHGGLLLAVLLAVSGETEPGALFIDLTEHVRSEGAAAGAGQPAAAPAGRAGAQALRPILAARSAPAPSPSLGTAEPSPDGEPDVSRGFALVVPGGGGGVVGPGAEYGAYLGRLRARVQQSLRYPLAARRRGLSGTVHVEIVIRPDGVISAVAVADSSAHAVLDDAAVETIRRLAPEPLPRDVPPRTLRVRLPVVFALE